MNEWYIVLPVTVLLIVLSAFFVIIEFALLAARRNRLEETVETSRSSRAALRSLNELTLMLAGAQLGITVVTFALGAVTKPWVHHALMPLFEWAHIPLLAADIIAFILSLFIVTFLHLVIGEMAPKSWAIAHPETALRAIALPARGFINLLRPLLQWINKMANALVRKTGETPVDRAAAGGYDADTLFTLVEHSRSTGALDQQSAAQISGIIKLEKTTVGEALAHTDTAPITVSTSATVAEVQAAAKRSGQLRVLIDVPSGAIPHVVHVRDTLAAAEDEQAIQWSRPILSISADTTLQETLDMMRQHSEQIAAVISTEGGSSAVLGVISWDILLGYMWPATA
ncbi:CNNM domain-containing protein [Corynebacterium crudilactis]|uniref:CNNM transmembrane domain-containing protein n=1 Tax=Corynebacterium crudilactis TaxID=1652495 RepID=A0A172QSR8_9CORY|nr:hemolysin family protein [Corynebacterium crudilactis]ANE03763.1 hypothetical protein ccrud_05755 [Corynebacterium crudilactis]